MRPTFLYYRSPKEKTGELLLPSVNVRQVTKEGKYVPFSSLNYKEKIGFSFPKDHRFSQYKYYENNTGRLVGPGTYNDNLKALKFLDLPCQVLFKKSPGIERKNSDGYIMVGDSMIYQPTFIKNDDLQAKKKRKLLNLSVDACASLPLKFVKYSDFSLLSQKAIQRNIKSISEDNNYTPNSNFPITYKNFRNICNYSLSNKHKILDKNDIQKKSNISYGNSNLKKLISLNSKKIKNGVVKENSNNSFSKSNSYQSKFVDSSFEKIKKGSLHKKYIYREDREKLLKIYQMKNYKQ